MQRSLAIAPGAETPHPKKRAGRPGGPGHPVRTALAIIGAALVAAIALFVIFFQWNWLRPPLAAWLSAQLHRPVRIEGDLRVRPWSWRPTASVEGLSIGQPRWAGGGDLLRLQRLSLGWRWKNLLFGPAILPFVELDRPALDLFADASGRANWKFAGAARGGHTTWPVIQRLIVKDGAVHYEDVKRRASFAGSLAADETGGEPGRGGATLRGHLLVRGAPWAGPTPVLDAPNLVIDTRLTPLMRGRLVLPLVEADGARIRLLRDAAGRESWSSGGKGQNLRLPAIEHLVLRDGVIRYDDIGRKLHFRGDLASSQEIGGGGAAVFRLVGAGQLNKAPFRALITGGALINVKKTTPYRFRAAIASGATRIGVAGDILHPFDFGQMTGALKVSGPNLGDLTNLTALALPRSPPYSLAAGFARRGSFWALRRLSGRVGRSDLAGSISVDHGGARPLLSADLSSRFLDLADLGAAFGAAPRRTAGHVLSPQQKATAARLAAEHKLLPDTPLNTGSLARMDARVSYHADRVMAGRTPLRSLAMKVAIEDAVLSIDPLQLNLPQGRLGGLVRIDARSPTRPATLIDLALSGAQLQTFIGKGKPNPPLEGQLYARARLAGDGDSIAAVAGTSNGTVAVVSPRGEIRQAFAELTGIDLSKGLYLLLSKNQSEIPINCAVFDFQARNGVLVSRDIVLDTPAVEDTGKGDIDLRNETLNLTLSGKPKKFRLLRLAAPITISGPLEKPKVGVQIGKAAPQLAASAILGIFAAPAAAIVPFIHPGGRKGANCPALIAQTPAGPGPVAASAGRPPRG
ncbi:MAG TPA: AsmA family protein [Caulobacteraceae bacterium]|nr:AsmA family protein [Caulobacteraceae bacterium]